MRLGTRAVHFSETVKLSCWLVDSRRDLDLGWSGTPAPGERATDRALCQGAAVFGCLDEHTRVCTADRSQDFC